MVNQPTILAYLGNSHRMNRLGHSHFRHQKRGTDPLHFVGRLLFALRKTGPLGHFEFDLQLLQHPRRAEVNRVVYDVVAALEGSISAEHGLGQLTREEIRRHKDVLELELMRTLKRVLDPQGLMNPGKML